MKGKNKPSGQAWYSNEASGTEERQLNRVQHLPLGFDSASAPMLSCLEKGRDGGRMRSSEHARKQKSKLEIAVFTRTSDRY